MRADTSRADRNVVAKGFASTISEHNFSCTPEVALGHVLWDVVAFIGIRTHDSLRLRRGNARQGGGAVKKGGHAAEQLLYRKALKASFPPDRLAGHRGNRPDGTLRFVLRAPNKT